MNYKYGNPTRNDIKYLSQESYLDTLLPELTSYRMNSDDSEQTFSEVNALIPLVNNLQNDPETEKRYIYYDTNFIDIIVNVCQKNGIPRGDVIQLIKNIKEDTSPIILKLKFHFERVRPFTMASYLQLELYPYESKAANTPSFPSGHAFQSKLFCNIIGNIYPQLYKTMIDVSDDICTSRLYLGVHYPTDIDFAVYCVDVVMNHPEFKKKYKL